jgi:hypothetical protein
MALAYPTLVSSLRSRIALFETNDKIIITARVGTINEHLKELRIYIILAPIHLSGYIRSHFRRHQTQRVILLPTYLCSGEK